MITTQQTRSWGHSTAIRLPIKILQAARWNKDQAVTISLRGQSIVLTPLKETPTKRLPTLEELLSGVKPDDVSGEIDWGDDRGKEVIHDKFN